MISSSVATEICTKRCIKCGEEKDLAQFYVHPQMLDGHLNICKDCVKERARSRTANDTDKVLASRLKTCARTSNKENARRAVDEAIRAGVLEKPDRCSMCGDIKRKRVLHAHHKDYKNPLDVVFVCARCHAKLDPQKWEKVECQYCHKMICRTQMKKHQDSNLCCSTKES